MPQPKKAHPALKHAAYSATTLLPGEDSALFKKLHDAIVAELLPVGLLEEDIVSQIAHLVWRKHNLATFRIARQATERFEQIKRKKMPELEHHIFTPKYLISGADLYLTLNMRRDKRWSKR